MAGARAMQATALHLNLLVCKRKPFSFSCCLRSIWQGAIPSRMKGHYLPLEAVRGQHLPIREDAGVQYKCKLKEPTCKKRWPVPLLQTWHPSSAEGQLRPIC